MSILKSIILFYLAINLNLVAQDYKKIIHFDRNDYLSPDIPVGTDINGIQGIVAGDVYLIVWNMNEFYVFDINSYQKLKTFPTETSIKQIAILNNKFYVLANLNYIYEYDIAGEIERYKFYSYVRNYTEMRKVLHLDEERATEVLNDGTKRQKRKSPTNLKKEAPWRRTDIRGIYKINNQIFLNIDWNYLKLNEDFLHERMAMELIQPRSGIVEIDFIFPKEEIIKNEDRYFFDNKFWNKEYLDYKYRLTFEIRYKDNFNSDIKEIASFRLIPKEEKNLDYAEVYYINKECFHFLCYWHKINNKEIEYSTIQIYKNKNLQKEIELPNQPSGGNIYTNPFRYKFCYNGYLYKISYNIDQSFDVLKINLN